MNILMATSSWYPSGGDWTYVNNICRIYESNNHKIIPFAMNDDRNFPSDFSKYFLSKIDYNSLNSNKSVSNSIKVLSRAIYSKEAVSRLNDLLTDINIDVAQLNNIHNIHTPSIIPLLNKKKIPIVWRILDYKIICPNRTLLSNDTICQKCINGNYFNCILNKCKKESYLASSVAALESYFYKYYSIYNKVDKYIFQSEFTRDIFVKFGFDINRTQIIENPFTPTMTSIVGSSSESHERYILYFGRISKEKGIISLVKAMKSLSNIKLKIIGTGPENSSVINLINELKLNNVEFLGAKWGDELNTELKACEFVVVPSEWYDPNPYVVLQAFDFSKPVVATDIGGLSDMISERVNGILVPPNNLSALSNAINDLYNNPKLIIELGQQARKQLENIYSPEKYYIKTIELFNKLVSKNSF